MRIRELIAKKRDGAQWSREELDEFLGGYLRGEVEDYQVSAWLMAVFFRGLSPRERADLTTLMWKSGESITRSPDDGAYWIDKHSTGGVGDKPSLVLVPLVMQACAKLGAPSAVKIPMVSGRGLGFSGGTLDKLESIKGFQTRIDLPTAEALLTKQGFFMMGQTERMAPLDRLLYALRDVTATVEQKDLIVASILSKKLSESLHGIVFDVKFGPGAFMKDLPAAESLASNLLEGARDQKVEALCVLTQMHEPIGYTIGNFLEVQESFEFISGRNQEAHLKDLVLTLASWMVYLASRRKVALPEARETCEIIVHDGSAAPLFRQMFESQGGIWNSYYENEQKLETELVKLELRAPQTGYIADWDPLGTAELVNQLGGGRRSKEHLIDPLVGMRRSAVVGDAVKEGQTIAVVYARERMTLPPLVTIQSQPCLRPRIVEKTLC